MKNILKKMNSKWFLLFLFMFFSVGMQAQWDENRIDEIIEDDGSWDDEAPLDPCVINDCGIILDEVVIRDPFMDFPEDDDWGFPDEEPLDFPDDELPPQEFTSSLDPKDCIKVCIGYSQLDPNECKCVAIPRPWYPDNDGDNWHNKDLPIINAIESPPGNYKDKTLGADCDDNDITVKDNCYKNYYIDNDGDDWDSGTINAINDNGGKYKLTTLGTDCDDNPATGANVHKLNKCGKCEAEPVSGLCGQDNNCDHILNGLSLTGQELAEILGWNEKKGVSKANLDEIAKYIDIFAKQFGMNSPEQRFHFYTQIAHETGNLDALSEGHSRYASSQSQYKGRGILMLTSLRWNYQPFQDYLTANGYNYDIINNPNLVSENMELAVLSGFWHWYKGGREYQYAIDISEESLLNVSKTVNCGSPSSDCGGRGGIPVGWKDRKANVERLKELLKDCIDQIKK